VALVVLDCRSRDADSRLYAEMAARMSTAPPSGWIAPDFPPGWYASGPFREHPVGLFVPAALLARAGYPAEHAAYALNALYQVATIVLLPRLALTLVDGLEARALGWLIQLLPVAFAYRVRANHEQLIVLCLVVALLGTERSRRGARGLALTVLGLVGLLLVKGVLAVFGPALCALWLLAHGRPGARLAPPHRAAWAGLAVGVAAMATAAVAYELLYRQATGQPFWSSYLSQQLGVAAVSQSAGGLAQKAYNLVWYLGRLLWFPFPWSLTFLAAGWHGRRLGRRSAPDAIPPPADAALLGAVFVAGMVLLYVGLFSLSDRRADRYIFPVYYAVGSAGAVAALRTWPRFRNLAERLDRPWVPAGVWCLAFLAHAVGGRLGLPTVKIWGPDT
jgi:4-amino-4-deoxy-L-arabinose transferase-like glycosyltransferase